jgi:hypothetical protein
MTTQTRDREGLRNLFIPTSTRERAAVNLAADRAGLTQQAFVTIKLLRAAGRADLAKLVEEEPKQQRMQAEREELGEPKPKRLPRGEDESPITIRLNATERAAIEEAAELAGFGPGRRQVWNLTVLLEATELADELQTAAAAAEQLRQYRLALSRVRAA